MDNLPEYTSTSGDQDTHPTEEDKEEELLLDACTLLGVRWGMQLGLHRMGSNVWAYGTNTRFHVSDNTLQNALGGLSLHVHFLKGNVEHSLADLVRFEECKRKWGVPNQVTSQDAGSGRDKEEHPYFKRRKQ